MAIKLALAESGKVLTASQHLRGSKPRKEFASVRDHLARVRRNRARPHHAARRLECQIERRCEIHFESQRVAVLANDLAVLAKQFAIAAGEHFSRRRRGPERIAEPVDCSALEINASKQGSVDA